MSPPRIFVSHSHKDDKFTERLVRDLLRAGADVWVDKARMTPGNFMERISEALEWCEWLVLVLTPNAVTSKYVRKEVFTALNRVEQGYVRAVIPVLAAPCAPGTVPAVWDDLHRYDATTGYKAALTKMLRDLGLSPVVEPTPATMVMVQLHDSSEDVMGLMFELVDSGVALVGQQRYAEAIPILEHATQVAPDYWYAAYYLAYAHNMLNQWEQAIPAWERALTINPSDAMAWFYQGVALAGAKRHADAVAAYEQALAACDQAIAVNPQDDDAWKHKARALRALGREAEAENAERRSSELTREFLSQIFLHVDDGP